MKLWHKEFEDFVLAYKNPGLGFVSAEDECQVDIFCFIFNTKEEAEAEAELVNDCCVDDVSSEVFQYDGKYFVVTLDWCGENGLMLGQLCHQRDVERTREIVKKRLTV